MAGRTKQSGGANGEDLQFKPLPRKPRSVGQFMYELWIVYDTTFAFYMLEPWEKFALHIMLALFLGMSGYTTYYYFYPWVCIKTGLFCEYIVMSGGGGAEVEGAG